jgi:hypothetical protein
MKPKQGKAAATLGNDLINAMKNGLTNQQPAIIPPVVVAEPPKPQEPDLCRPHPARDPRYAILRNPDWPQAKWDVSGAFIYQKFLTDFEDYFWVTAGLRMVSFVHGAPLCFWNGGRVKGCFQFPKPKIEFMLQEYDKREIPVELTFTNSMLREEHLEDPVGNGMLEMLNQYNRTGENGVILCSELLYDHVKKNFPKLKRIASVVKVSHEQGAGNLDYYRRLEERFDKIMIHPDDNFNLELLQKLEDKSRYEILVNEPCIRDCPVRKRHYQILSQLALNFLDARLSAQEAELRDKNRCNEINDLLFDPKRRTLVLSDAEIKQLYDLGFRNFKIQGRGMNSEQAMLLELFRLMLNHDPACSHIIARVMHRFFIGG